MAARRQRQAAFTTTVENTGGGNWPQPGSDEIDVSEFTSSTTVDGQNVISGNSGFLTCKPTVSAANASGTSTSSSGSPVRWCGTIKNSTLPQTMLVDYVKLTR